MQFNAKNFLLLAGIALIGSDLIGAAPQKQDKLTKVFNYQGAMPIRDDRTGEIIKSNETAEEVDPVKDEEMAAAEAACWKLIVEQSGVTFALQNKVLDELDSDMKNLKMDQTLRDLVDQTTKRMRKTMADASDALSRNAAEEFFDALFDASEDIIKMSSLIRDPKLDDTVFLTLVKAISRLGRNNTALIQDFTDVCSLMQRSPKPRFVGLF